MTAVISVGAAVEDWTGDAEFWEYSKAANPLATGHTSAQPMGRLSSLGLTGTRVLPFDLSAGLAIDRGPATSPALLASFVSIAAGDDLETAPLATCELYYVVRGQGRSAIGSDVVGWSAGDFFTLPGGSTTNHHADEDALFYWVTDEPLLRYLGVAPTHPRFGITRWDGRDALAELTAVATDPRAENANRVSILLAHKDFSQTLTATHTLWAMLGLLPVGANQRPHRHQSVALDLITDCQPGCYSLVGARIDEHGDIIRPTRIDWEPGGAFVTPPGMWHSHHNGSGAPAHLIPVQDAGLHTYLRSLDIRFAPADRQG
jgi:gentisate 1,2-dioxygenase